MINYERISKALVLLILGTSFFVARHVFWVITNFDFYTSIVGTIWIASVLPYFAVVIGCILFLVNRKHGLTLILVGSAFSFFGTAWSYVPYLPGLSPNPATRLTLLVLGNLTVLAVLIWSDRKQKPTN